MPYSSEKARVIQPSTAIIEGSELTRIGQIAHQERAHLLHHLFGGAAGVFTGLAAVATGTDRVISVGSGEGVDADGYPIVVPATVPTGGNASSVTLAVGDATHPRVDVVYLQSLELDGDITSTPTKASRTAAVVNQDLAHSKLWHFTIGVAQGTPAAMPAVPSVPDGALKICEVAVASGATVIGPGDLTDRRFLLPTIRPPGPQAFIFEGIGPLNGMIGYDLDQHGMVSGYVITSIQILCPQTPASGTIEIELFKCSPGGSPTTLYTTKPLPALTCNGGYALATYTAPNLPDVTTLAAGEILIARISGAPVDAIDLTVLVS